MVKLRGLVGVVMMVNREDLFSLLGGYRNFELEGSWLVLLTQVEFYGWGGAAFVGVR